MILKTGKDFSDKLVKLYEEPSYNTDLDEIRINTALAATSIDTAYKLLQETNSELAKLIAYDGTRYSISFKNLEKVYNDYADYANSADDSQKNPIGLLEF
jgi:hypothetical protein